MQIREDVLWEIQLPAAAPEDAEEPTDDAGAAIDETAAPGTTDGALVEFLVGQTPPGWETVTELTTPVEPGIRYTIRTEPDGQTIDFSTPDLQAGLLWDGVGVIQFNPDLIDEDCSTAADVGAFAQNNAVLLALGTTTAAIVLVILILILFVITSRFSRIRAIQKKAAREAQEAGNAPTS